MKQLPIRFRLTLWYFAMFAAAAMLLSLSSWWMLRRTLDATIQQDLQERTDDVRVQLQLLSAKSPSNEMQASFDAMYHYRDDGKWLQILDQDGHWVYRSPRMQASNAPLSSPAVLPTGGLQSDFETSGHTVRTYASRVLVNGHSYAIETGISMTKPQVLLRDFGLSLLLLTPPVLLAAALAGHLLSRKAMRPVAAIAHEARRITDRNLDTRLTVPQSDDELSHLSETLNNMLARIDASFRSVREFTANASHELRTPLTRLRTDVEIALFRPRPAMDYRQTLERVLHDAVEMSDLIESLLTLARAEAGSEVLRLVPVDLYALIDDAVREWTPVAEGLSIQLTSWHPLHRDTKELTVLADQASIFRLIRILLDNACKFTKTDGTIVISATPCDDHVVLAVKDSGIGIAPEHQESIFKRFYRIDQATGSHSKGSGLGLTLAAWIAEQHKSSISLESAVGSGSKFELKLRRASDDGEDKTEYRKRLLQSDNLPLASRSTSVD